MLRPSRHRRARHRQGSASASASASVSTSPASTAAGAATSAPSSLPPVPPAPTRPPLPASPMARYLRHLQQRMRRLGAPPTTSFADSYAGEFDALLDADRRAAREPARFAAASAVDAALRNRYSNVLADDRTRVRLRARCAGCDYVNANAVPAGVEGEEGYIATQAPTPETFAHFWQMVFEGRVAVVVMLTREFEGRSAVAKSDRYWPEPGSVVEFGAFVVEGVGERGVDEPIVERRFVVRRRSTARGKGGSVERDDGGADKLVVTQLQYVDWPDQDVPESPAGLLELRTRAAAICARERVATSQPQQPPPPVVVHCSAGVGRTGTYIAVDQTLRRVAAAIRAEEKRGEDGDDPSATIPDIYAVVHDLKLARAKMVQTWEQYRFIFHAVHDGAQALLAASACSGGSDGGAASVFTTPMRSRTAPGVPMGGVGVGFEDDDVLAGTPEMQLNNTLPTTASLASGAVVSESTRHTSSRAALGSTAPSDSRR